MKQPVLLILAAGHGSRFGGLKQLSEIGPQGETIMDLSMRDALEIGFGKIVMVIQASMLEELSEKYSRQQLPVVFCVQEQDVFLNVIRYHRKKPWGTAHAVLSAGNYLEQPFMVINSDDYYGYQSLKIGYEHLVQSNESCAVLFP